MRHCVVAIAVLALAGCFDDVTGAAAIRCTSQAECPAGLTCVEERGSCFTADEIAGRVCGDGFVGDGETCDDGIANRDTSPTPVAAAVPCRRAVTAPSTATRPATMATAPMATTARPTAARSSAATAS